MHNLKNKKTNVQYNSCYLYKHFWKQHFHPQVHSTFAQNINTRICGWKRGFQKHSYRVHKLLYIGFLICQIIYIPIYEINILI